jgi:hypothetical protein
MFLEPPLKVFGTNQTTRWSPRFERVELRVRIDGYARLVILQNRPNLLVAAPFGCSNEPLMIQASMRKRASLVRQHASLCGA